MGERNYGTPGRLSGWSVLPLAVTLAAGGWAVSAAAQAPAAPAGKKPAQPAAKLLKRDPFKSLLMKPGEGPGAEANLPPGKRGLVVAQLSVNGIVATPTENIAVVTMPGRNRAYFLRQRDELYNGYVERITGDGVVFMERSTDAFGRVFEKEVVKQITGGRAVTRPGVRR
jgi:hypothetical protein